MNENINEDTMTPVAGFPANQTNTFPSSDIKEKDIVIHTMPKRFLVALPKAQKARSTGLVILVCGVLVLIGSLAGLYFYLTKFDSNANSLNENENTATTSEETKQANNPPIADKQGDAEKAADAEAVKNSSLASQPDTVAIATSTKVQPEKTDIPEPPIATSTGSGIEVNAQNQPVGVTNNNIAYPSDSDRDGLFDPEEKLLGTDENLADTDADSYNDLAELLGLYNPAGSGKLIINTNIDKYINSQFGYTLLYPISWKAENVGGEESIIFKLNNNQFIQIMVENNPDKKALNNWYLEKTGADAIKNDQYAYKQGWEGIKTTDGLTVYLTKFNLDKIIILTYSLGTGNSFEYPDIYNMMINSLEISK